MATTSSLMSANTSQAPASPPLAIEVRDLVKRYARATSNAVDDVSFHVGRGEIFGLLGPNGAGKTTTIGVLTTFVRPTSGYIRVMGEQLSRGAQSIKQRIAVVPQVSNLDRSLKVREILTFHAAYHGVPRREREQRADALLDQLGLGDRKNEKVTAYSGGMVQRIMIARALMHAPDILFLDEPTNNLDPQSRLFLWERIRELNAEGLTILLTTHDMEEADQLCQRIAIMDHGKVLVNDTPEQLKKIIPGGTALELRVRAAEGVAAGAAAADSTERVLAALRALPGVTQVDELHASVEAPSSPAPAGPWGGGAGSGGSGESGGDAPDERGVATYRLYAEDVSALIGAAAQAALAAGAEVRDLRVQRPSLENVFIYLTGRNLR
ncbi:MAG TPA: ABC transporter ATP-binding protein [Ktedonobacterales bacterium]|nr:ABC transporter ATP-binding protein [Ktedonobacterales bacterium]